ncbi:flagellar basal body rod protein FlgF [Tahibacter soli]|uniref:Flagellar basal-body rod protein FlgF n=1 Tax=Tahibacter soli TaxID=2983605 RepID=A0A9X3YIA2_9GAMM|nr:flagellar basal body rod protein FlgF [Tahibacter soli]MDC8012846.1 flagellar basal body rod protein FlgF [Tahibacter soli]
MDKGIYVAMTGAAATLKAQTAVSHNLANIDTAGFKAMLVRTDPYYVDPTPGAASRVDATSAIGGVDTSSGPLIQTGGALDVALAPDRWLAVQDSAGNEAYTRAGDLTLTPNGILTTASGRPVLGASGPLTLPPHASVSVGADGTVSIVPQGEAPDAQAVIGRLRVVDASAVALERGEDGLMRAPAGTTLEPAAGKVLTSGAIEGSNVGAAQSLVTMIALSRQFEMQVRVLQTSDENARSANSLLRPS